MRAWPFVIVALVGAIAHASPQLPSRLRAPIDDELQLASRWEWRGRVVATGASADAAIAERAARAFIAERIRDAAPGMSALEMNNQLVLVADQLDERGARTIGFAQRWRNLE